MSTVAEIEAAIQQLPVEQQEAIRCWIENLLLAPSMQQGIVDWNKSAALTRLRSPESCANAKLVLETLNEARD